MKEIQHSLILLLDFLVKYVTLQQNLKQDLKECSETNHLEPGITVINDQRKLEEEELEKAYVVENHTDCENKSESCDFISENKSDMEKHEKENHSDCRFC